jgi:hypothetical protein
MSIQGKWRITEMPAYDAGYPDMMEPAYILFDKTGSEFAFGCVTGAIHGSAGGKTVKFTWSGNDGRSLRRWMDRTATGRNPRRTDLAVGYLFNGLLRQAADRH